MHQEAIESLLGDVTEVVSEDGQTYTIKPFMADVDSAKRIMHCMEGLSLLSRDTSVEEFKRMLLSRYTVVLDMDCGVMIAYNMRPQVDTDLTFVFYDGIVSGRQKLILSAIDWYMQTFSLNRVTLYLPTFAFKAINRYKRIGFRVEGRKQDAIFSDGRWQDVLIFGLTRNQLTSYALEKGFSPLSQRELKNYRIIKAKYTTEEVLQDAESG